MSMGSSQADGEVLVDINTTPLITLPIQTHAVKLDMPRPNQAPPTTEPVVVALGVDFDGSISWNGEKVDRPTLDTRLYDASHQPTPPEIQIDPNRLAKYDAVAMVLADAQHLGVTHIGFTGIDQYNQ